MPKLGRFLSGQIVANAELQNKQDLPTVFGPCLSYNPHNCCCFVCVCVRQPNGAKIQDHPLAYMSFPLAFSYISH